MTALRINPAQAWIVAAIAIAQVCIAVIGLFKKGGPGLPELLSAEMDALQSISQEIGVINQKLDLIYQSLAQIQKLLEELPDAVVTAQNQALVKGAFNRHQELLTAYIYERSRSGIDAALKATGDHFETEVLQRIRIARDDLFNRRVESTIPTLARALQVEVQTMILLNYSTGLIRSALAAYQRWFTWWGDEAAAAAFPKQVARLQEQAKELPHKGAFSIWRCYKDVRVSYDSETRMMTYEGGTEVTYELNGQTSQAQADELNEGLNIRDEGAALPDIFFGLRVGDLISSTKTFSGKPQNPIVGLPGICPGNVEGVVQNARDELVETAAALRTRFLAKVSLALAASQSAKYCDTCLKALVLK